MGDRGAQLRHRRDAITLRERHLRFAVSPLALAQLLLRPLALGQIEHIGNALVSAFVEGRSAEEHGHPAAVLSKVLLLERFVASGRPELYRSPFLSVVPFGGCQLSPAEATRKEIVAAVSHHAEKCFVGLENATFKIPHDD